jgi:CRP-like cAMP-binding protein
MVDALASAVLSGMVLPCRRSLPHASRARGVSYVTNIEERLPCLRGIGILAASPEHVLIAVAEALTEVTVEAGQTVFAKGELGDSLYIIADGEVGIFDGPLVLDHHRRGDVFGEMAVLDSQPRSATVVATTACRLYRLSSTAFRRLLSERSEVAEGVITVLCARQRDTNSDRSEDYEYICTVAMLTAAAHDLELGRFGPESLHAVVQRTDALGNLARVFQGMAREVQAREEALKQQVRELSIVIDTGSQDKAVAEIADTDFFRDLQRRARSIRGSRTFDDALQHAHREDSDHNAAESPAGDGN